MAKGMTSPVSFLLVLCIIFVFPAGSLAGKVMIFKGSTLTEGNMEGLVTFPSGLVVSRMEVEVASWGVDFGSDDFLLYDPDMGICSLYGEGLILNLPSFDEVLTSTDGRSGTLGTFLEEGPYVSYDTDLRMVETTGLFASSAPPPADTTPPQTFINEGPSEIINQRDVTFTFSGSDNATSTSNLVYAYFLGGYDEGWSGYVSTTSKTYNNLPNGDYVFWVMAQDGSQNVDQTPDMRSFRVAYPYIAGDLKEDGAVNLLDAILALRVCAGIGPVEISMGADVNSDGKIDLVEVIYILQNIAIAVFND